jgi:hypothetical protein
MISHSSFYNQITVSLEGQKIIAQEGDFVLSPGVYAPILDG